MHAHRCPVCTYHRPESRPNMVGIWFSTDAAHDPDCDLPFIQRCEEHS